MSLIYQSQLPVLTTICRLLVMIHIKEDPFQQKYNQQSAGKNVIGQYYVGVAWLPYYYSS